MALKHTVARHLHLGPLVRWRAAHMHGGHRSFSQCGEDVFLMNEGHFPDTGTYVDVGAAHPIYNSNTFAFYLKGWTGVTIEPNPDHVALHRIVRPGDTIVSKGVGLSKGSLTYHCYANPDQNTFDDGAHARAARYGATPIGQKEIGVAPLASLLDEADCATDVHFMSVDCEGFDLQVLRSNDWDRYRPRWCLVEDLEAVDNPFTTSAIHAFMTSIGYRRAAQIGFTAAYRTTG